MAKKKLKSLAEVDQALNDIAEIDAQIKKIDTDAQEDVNRLLSAETQKEINDIRIQCSSDQEPLNSKKEELKEMIAEYQIRCKDLIFNGRKSLVLNCGEIGYSSSTSTEVSDKTVEKLKKQGLLQCIRMTESVKIDVLNKMGPDVLKTVGARLVTTENHYYKLPGEKKATLRKVVI